MKTILVPLDHTAAAEHTLAYANKLAVRWPAEVVVLYCHPTSAGVTALELAAEQQRLRSLVERLRYQQLTRQDGRRIRYHYRVQGGCLHDYVQEEAARCSADLVVMGLEHIDCGKTEAPGNHAVTIRELVSCPVLVVPPGRRALPSRLAFVADFNSLDVQALPRLSALQQAFPAPLDLVQFYAPSQRFQRRQLKHAVGRAASQLTWSTCVTHLLEEDAPIEGISEFCVRQQIQLLIIAPARADQLRQYFDSCYATTQAYHTQIPVLLLPPPARPTAVACCERCASRLGSEKAQTALPDYHAVHWA